MKKILACFALLAAVGLTSSVASAAAACVQNENVLALPGGACSIGGLTFSSFTSNSNSTLGITIATLNTNGFTLNPNLPTNVPGSSMDDINLQFEVTGGVSGVGLSLNGNQFSFVNETVCDAAGFTAPGTGKCAGTQLAFLTAFGTGSGVSASFATNNPIWIYKDINDGGAALSEATQVYTSTPEPMTLSMMGVGLLGLSLISRRRKKS